MRPRTQFLLFLLLLVAPALVSQTGLTSLRGTVSDPSGAVVNGAQVIVKNMAVGLRSSRISDLNGNYEFSQICRAATRATKSSLDYPQNKIPRARRAMGTLFHHDDSKFRLLCSPLPLPRSASSFRGIVECGRNTKCERSLAWAKRIYSRWGVLDSLLGFLTGLRTPARRRAARCGDYRCRNKD